MTAATLLADCKDLLERLDITLGHGRCCERHWREGASWADFYAADPESCDWLTTQMALDKTAIRIMLYRLDAALKTQKEPQP